MIKVIFFDLGGVFAEAHFKEKEEEFNQILKPTGLSWKDFASTWGKFYILRSSGKIKNIEESEIFLRKITQKDIPIRKLTRFIINEVFSIPQKNINIVKKLKKNYKVAILSNSIKEWINGIFQNYEIEDLFHAVIVSSEVGARKPKIRIYQGALKEFNIKPQESIFISDEIEDDLCMASLLGIKTIWLNKEKKEKKGKILERYRPDFVIQNLNKVLHIVKKIK